jgi:hypothetical protein
MSQEHRASGFPPAEPARGKGPSWDPDETWTLLPALVEPAVWLHVLKFSELGGPDSADLEWARHEAVELLACHGDHLFRRSRRDPSTAEVFNALARALAILSHLPGGVTFGGRHFDASQIVAHFSGAEEARRYVESWQRQGKSSRPQPSSPSSPSSRQPRRVQTQREQLSLWSLDAERKDQPEQKETP